MNDIDNIDANYLDETKTRKVMIVKIGKNNLD